jgi:hypothetical protein
MRPKPTYPGTIIELDGEIVVKNIEDGEISCYTISNIEDAVLGAIVEFEFRKWNSSIVKII